MSPSKSGGVGGAAEGSATATTAAEEQGRQAHDDERRHRRRAQWRRLRRRRRRALGRAEAEEEEEEERATATETTAARSPLPPLCFRRGAHETRLRCANVPRLVRRAMHTDVSSVFLVRENGRQALAVAVVLSWMCRCTHRTGYTVSVRSAHLNE